MCDIIPLRRRIEILSTVSRKVHDLLLFNKIF